MTNPRPAIRLIAADMDGTLLNNAGEISPGNARAIHLAQKKGVIFAICSGRFPENAAITARDGDVECPIVALNGGCITERTYGDLIVAHPMAPQTVRAVFDALEEIGALYYFFGRKTVYTRNESHIHHSQKKYGDRLIHEADVRYLFGVDACLDGLKEDIFKYYVYSQPGHATLPQIREKLLTVPGIQLTQSSNTNIEIMPPNIDKATGLRELAEYYGIPLEATMALGDHDNDVPMLVETGLSVAMDNAEPHVKDIADVITGSNTNDGVAQAIYKYVL